VVAGKRGRCSREQRREQLVGSLPGVSSTATVMFVCQPGCCDACRRTSTSSAEIQSAAAPDVRQLDAREQAGGAQMTERLVQ
jgi:hypothetical protein